MTTFDWTFVESFSLPRRLQHGWDETARWSDGAARSALERTGELQPLIAAWDARLAGLGGDPSVRAWHRFRPLRWSREEAWSDWLGELLASSTSGCFGYTLLEASAERSDFEAYKMPVVDREKTAGNRRADLVIRHKLRPGFLHIEVKIGNRQFAKTKQTAVNLTAKYSGPARDFILLPDYHVDIWNESCASFAGENIKVVTWGDVNVALRRALWRRCEDPVWSAWAFALVGCIERKILGIDHAQLRAGNISLALSASAVAWRQLLEAAKGEE